MGKERTFKNMMNEYRIMSLSYISEVYRVNIDGQSSLGGDDHIKLNDYVGNMWSLQLQVLQGNEWGKCKILAEYFELGNLEIWRGQLGVKRANDKCLGSEVENGVSEQECKSSYSNHSDSSDKSQSQQNAVRDSLNFEEIQQIFKFCERIVEIVENIHKIGVSHQDLKLDNLMLCLDKYSHTNVKEQYLNLKLIDFENGSLLNKPISFIQPIDVSEQKIFEARYGGSVYNKPP